MGKKSTKENKNIYQTSREETGLTREKACKAYTKIYAYGSLSAFMRSFA